MTRTARRVEGPFFHRPHDHQRCIEKALEKAALLCEERGARLTELRRRVLALVWRSHAPVGAYDILEQLRRDGRGAAPPTVYRALDFLRDHGLVHRIESLNAFIGCPHPDETHVSQFLICTSCSTVAEIDDAKLRAALAESAATAGFAVDRLTVELRGRCPRCDARSSRRPNESEHAR